MITIKNLIISYTNSQNVIDDLNLELLEQTIHGIVGLNGAGKTTFLNALFGLKGINSGTISYNENKLSKKEIAYLVTENFFYSNITGREYLSLYKNKLFDENKWNQLFLLPLDTIIDNYSTGMKKKLAIMGILKQDKSIMILDEPFNGLDIETVRIIRQVLLKLKEKGKTIIITSHIVETLTSLCDFIHYLESGKIKFSKDKTEFAEFEQQLFADLENKNEGLIKQLFQ
jgi:ABC-2 type transport system ATP-binding protein